MRVPRGDFFDGARDGGRRFVEDMNDEFGVLVDDGDIE